MTKNELEKIKIFKNEITKKEQTFCHKKKTERKRHLVLMNPLLYNNCMVVSSEEKV